MCLLHQAKVIYSNDELFFVEVQKLKSLNLVTGINIERFKLIRVCPKKTSAVRVGGSFVLCRQFADKGGRLFSDADIHTFWCKSIGFFEIYGVIARTRGVELVWTFCGQEKRGLIFANLCRRPLWTAPYIN